MIDVQTIMDNLNARYDKYKKLRDEWESENDNVKAFGFELKMGVVRQIIDEIMGSDELKGEEGGEGLIVGEYDDGEGLL